MRENIPITCFGVSVVVLRNTSGEVETLLMKRKKSLVGAWCQVAGRLEKDETGWQAALREMKEETHLHVRVERLLLEFVLPGGVYKRKTYLCSPIAGRAQPGYEPEPEAAQDYAITEVAWFDLRDETTWDPLAVRNSITYPLLLRIRAALGYGPQDRP